MTVPRMCALLLAVALGALPAPRHAAMAAPSAGEITVAPIRGRIAGAELQVRGQPVARLFGSSARARLRAAAARLDPLLPPPTAVTVRAARRTAALVVDGTVVLSITRADAARERMAPGPLVQRWAKALKAALEVAPISLSRLSMVLSPGRTETVSIATAGSAPVTLGEFNGHVVEVRLRPGEAQVTGKRPGSTFVPVRIGPYRMLLAVSVRPPAGHIPAATEVIVTGDPATPELIREAVDRRLQEVVRRDPGASTEYPLASIDAPLAAGRSMTVPVTVQVRSPFAGPVDGSVAVRVTNIPVRLGDPDILLVSNRPEKITDNGWLFQEMLVPGKPARLLYHHINGTPGQTRVLKITLHNLGGAPARVHYLSGHAGPSGDPIFIGFASTLRFLDALVAGRGYIVEVPSGSASTFTAYTLPPLALVSGLMQFQVIDGGPIDLIVHVRVPYLLDRTVTTDLGPGAFPHPRGTFPGSVVDLVREQPANQPGTVAELGIMSNLRDIRTGEALVGDYGVLYRLRLRLVNPTAREVTTALVANAAGGPARGLFFINGTPVDVGLIRATEDREITTFSVPPASSLEIAVLTMPVAGSFYPVRLGLRPR